MLSLTAVGPLPEARVGRGGTIGADMVGGDRSSISEDCAMSRRGGERTAVAGQYNGSGASKPKLPRKAEGLEVTQELRKGREMMQKRRKMGQERAMPLYTCFYRPARYVATIDRPSGCWGRLGADAAGPAGT